MGTASTIIKADGDETGNYCELDGRKREDRLLLLDVSFNVHHLVKDVWEYVASFKPINLFSYIN